MPKQPSRKTLKNKCDKLWRIIIRYPDICEMCGEYANNPHHIIGRDNHAVRWDIRNGCLLCSGCHRLNNGSAHQDLQDFMIWFERKRKEDYEYLLVKKNEIWDKNYDTVLAYLQPIYERVKGNYFDQLLGRKKL